MILAPSPFPSPLWERGRVRGRWLEPIYSFGKG